MKVCNLIELRHLSKFSETLCKTKKLFYTILKNEKLSRRSCRPHIERGWMKYRRQLHQYEKDLKIQIGETDNQNVKSKLSSSDQHFDCIRHPTKNYIFLLSFIVQIACSTKFHDGNRTRVAGKQNRAKTSFAYFSGVLSSLYTKVFQNSISCSSY